MFVRFSRAGLGVIAAVAVAGVGLAGTHRPAQTVESAAAVESYALPDGRCDNVASTWPAGTSIQTIADAVEPRSALSAIWRLENVEQRYVGFSPLPSAAAAGANDLERTVRFADALWICTNQGGAVLNRPNA